MNPPDAVLFRQLPLIQKIIQDETWLEAERRGCWVPAHDRVVRENVCLIILRIGQELRETLSASAAQPLPAPAEFPPERVSQSNEAA
jgi:hypothetical protein